MTGNNSNSVVSLALMIVLMTMSQLLFKLAGLQAKAVATWWQMFAFNWPLWGGLTLSAAGFLFWINTLRHMKLSAAYPWTALIYLLTPLDSWWLFADPLNAKYGVGLCFILLGIVLTSGGVATDDRH